MMVKTRARGKNSDAAATRREHLTDRRIRALPIPEKTSSIYDAKSSLGLRLTPTGKRAFFWFHSVNGKPTWRNIGEHPTISLDVARDKAREYDGLLATWRKENFRGPNPFARPETSGELTLEGLAELYIDRNVLLHAADAEKAAKDVRDSLTRYVPDWKSKPLGEICRADVLKLHTKLGKGIGLRRKESGRSTANHTVDLLRTLFNWAIENELWAGVNPARLRKKQRFDEPQRKRCLGPEELLRLQAACEKTPNRDLAHFVILSLATGQRKKTVMRARWSAIDLLSQTWTLAASETKNKKEFTVELSPAACRVFAERLAGRAPGIEWVFPGRDPKRPRFDFNQPGWRALLKSAGLLHPRKSPLNFRGHDLRHTFVSYAVMAGKSLEQVGAAVGHLSPASTRRYAHLTQQVQRETVLAGEAEMQKRIEAARKQLPA